MRPQHIALMALALLAGSAGYVVQHWLSRPAAAPALAVRDDTIAGSEPARPLDWSFATAAGGREALSAWAGKIIVLNFWATWCPPCLREIPAFVELQTAMGPDGVQFVGIALDQAEPVQAFVTDKGVNYPVLIGDQDVARFMVTLGNTIGALPYTVVLGRNGEVVTSHQGEWDAEAAGAILRKLVETP
jgi:thiol-disulfide isomerase/thioredoxin